MEPRTKIQKKIIGLSKALPAITSEQVNWAEQKMDKVYVVSRNRNFCLECGHKWKPELGLECVLDTYCPNCGKKLIYHTDNSVNRWFEHFAYVSTFKGYQVIRIFAFYKHLKKQTAAYYYHQEVIQHWMTEDGKYRTITGRANPMNGYYDSWISGSDLEFRYDTYSQSQRERISPSATYPRMNALPIFRRNGARNSVHGVSPVEFFRTLLNDSKFETLLKAKQTKILKDYNNQKHEVRHYWRSILICIRNGYKIPDLPMWVDYLDLLRRYGKDLHNAKYVCPKNLKKEHDKYVAKREIELEKQRIEKKIKDDKEFAQAKGIFFGIEIKSGQMSIAPLKSLKEFKEEGEALKHCVFANEYYQRKDALILSAKIEGKSIETIEIDLKRMQVVQSRGLQNQPTEHHDQIVNLVNKNLPLFRKAMVS